MNLAQRTIKSLEVVKVMPTVCVTLRQLVQTLDKAKSAEFLDLPKRVLQWPLSASLMFTTPSSTTRVAKKRTRAKTTKNKKSLETPGSKLVTKEWKK